MGETVQAMKKDLRAAQAAKRQNGTAVVVRETSYPIVRALDENE